MTNITVSVPEAVLCRALIYAAQQGMSLSALVHDYLVSLAADPAPDPPVDRRRLAQEELFRRLDQKGQGLSAADRQLRRRLHDRLA